MLKLFAHAEEVHESAVETALHTATPWYLAIPVFLILLALIGYVTWLISGRKMDKVLIVLAVLCLISGFTLFNLSVAVSVIAITLGLLLSLFLTFVGLSSESSEK